MAAEHLAPIGGFETDWAAVAERFLGAPYLWGGRESLGLDCSGLVQQALFACGLACPRDADQQAELGQEIGRADFAARRPGVLEGPRGDRPRREPHRPRQRPPHDGGDRAAGDGHASASRRPALGEPTAFTAARSFSLREGDDRAWSRRRLAARMAGLSEPRPGRCRPGRRRRRPAWRSSRSATGLPGGVEPGGAPWPGAARPPAAVGPEPPRRPPGSAPGSAGVEPWVCR